MYFLVVSTLLIVSFIISKVLSSSINRVFDDTNYNKLFDKIDSMNKIIHDLEEGNGILQTKLLQQENNILCIYGALSVQNKSIVEINDVLIKINEA